MIQTVHTAVPGRARYQVPSLYRSPGLKHHLETRLAADGEIETATANPLTGTLLIRFQSTCNATEIARRVEAAVAAYPQADDLPAKMSNASAQPLNPPDWHRLPLEEVVGILVTDPAAGLPCDEAQQRLEQYGTNQLQVSRGRSPLAMVMEQFTTWPVALLSTAALLSVATGSPIDAGVIMGVVGLNAVIGYVTESQSERIIRSLHTEPDLAAEVIRGGKTLTVPGASLVPGDLLLLKAGKYVQADARLVNCEHLTIDESPLTGESVPVAKQSAPLTAATLPLGEQSNRVFRGSFVTSGHGQALVVATGEATEMGKIQSLVGETATLETPLQTQLGQVSGQLVLLCGGVCAAIFGVGLLRGYGLLLILKNSISLAVAAVPEGLPAVATTTLALGIRNMRRRKILIRALNAVETLGAVQVFCMDKTGTITHNRMQVEEVHLASGSQPKDRAAPPPPELLQLLRVAALCSESQVTLQGEDYQVQGSPTENALIDMALAADVDVLALRQAYPLQATKLRSENRPIMSTRHSTPEGGQLAAVKGSPEAVLERCRHWLYQGQVQPLTDANRQTLARTNQQMAGKALRVLAIAYRELNDAHDDPEADLVWLGLVGMADPIRSGVPTLMEQFHRAGIDTVMITGDQSSTAYAIGKQLNLNRTGQLRILDATELAQLEAEALRAFSGEVNIFARISPADKLQIVRALQSANKVVAMTGDGINDTPALKAANVGLAMGSGQSQGVHEVADVVIQDDNLETLIDAVSQGRTVYSNIRKAVHFLLATNLSEIMVVAIATTMGLGQPLNAIQLLWLNLVTDVFPSLGLALEPPEGNVLEQPPRDPHQRIMQAADFQRIAWEASVISAAAVIAYAYGLSRYGISSQASTIAFMGLTVAQVLHTFSCRSETHRWFDPQPLPRNPYGEVATIGSLALQLLPLAIPPLGSLLKVVSLQAPDYLVIAIAALLPLLVNEATKPWPSQPQNISR